MICPTSSICTLEGHPVITDEHAHKILFDNAADIYRFDRAMLQPHVDRVGFEVEDLLAANPA